MKAVYFTEHGGPEVLTYGDVPEPEIGSTEIKVRVRACALNRLDLFTRAGARGTRMDLSGPHILGGDIAGDVAEVGSGVTQLKVGDRVVVNARLTCGQCDACVRGETELCVRPGMIGSTTSGGYAEYAKAPAANAAKLPDSLSYVQAASLPTVFLPCWTIFMRRAMLKPWETVLIVSASSGVGTAAIQVAKNVIGATVITTTSSDEKAKQAKELGADHVINYKTEDVAGRIKELTGKRGVNVVLDHVGADSWAYAMPSLAVGGRYGICGVTSGYKVELQMGLMFLKHQTVFGVFMGRNGDLRNIVEMAGRGVVKGVVHATYPLKDARKAHEDMDKLGFFGKLVLEVP
ncbi:MAG: zinc-binding dehydrogenase [Chloroflexi bacterium]|nr:zinc-binding dehydrogenase [Chloroflexota bacterium]